MRQANLLLLNIFATIARMVATVFMGLWTTRLVYRTLGEEGFGVYAAALALTLFLTLVVDAVGAAAQRHIAFAIGKKDLDKVRELVGTAVTLNLGLATLIATGTWFGAGLLEHLVQAGPEHASHLIVATRWIGLTAAVITVQAPFKSYLIARQSIVVVTVYELIESASRLSAALALGYLVAPTIAGYALATCIAVGLPTLVFCGACLALLPTTRPGRPTATGEIGRFGFWLFVGVLGWKIRTQGAQILINNLCGPVATTAYNVSLQLAMYQNNLTAAVNRAARPAVVTSRGGNRTDQVRALTRGSSKLLSLCTLFFALPLLFETHAVLTLWLGDAPELMVIMVRLTLVWMSVKDLTAGHTMAIHAGGRVAMHEVGIALIDTTAMAVAAAVIYFSGAPAWSVPVAVTAGVMTQGIFKVVVFGSEASSTLSDWLVQVVARYAATAAIGTVVAVLVQAAVPFSPARLPLVLLATGLSTTVCIVWIGFDASERRRIGGLIANGVSRVRNRVKSS